MVISRNETLTNFYFKKQLILKRKTKARGDDCYEVEIH